MMEKLKGDQASRLLLPGYTSGSLLHLKTHTHILVKGRKRSLKDFLQILSFGVPLVSPGWTTTAA